MTKGSPPMVSFSAVEKNLTYVGYASIALTATWLSTTRGFTAAGWAKTAAARPPGSPPTITRSASLSIVSAISDAYDCAQRTGSFPTDDVIATRPPTLVRDLRFDQRLDSIEV